MGKGTFRQTRLLHCDEHCVSFLGPFLAFLVGFERKEQLLLDEGEEKKNLLDFLKTPGSSPEFFCSKMSDVPLVTHVLCAEQVFVLSLNLPVSKGWGFFLWKAVGKIVTIPV